VSVATWRTRAPAGPGHHRLIGARGPTLIDALDGRGGDTVIRPSNRNSNRVAADAGDRLVGPCTKVKLA
jgi:hypothetical protein